MAYRRPEPLARHHELDNFACGEPALDEWLKDIAPTPELRTWWSHDPERFEDFAQRYRDELDANPAVETLREALDEHETVTLLFAARDPEVNHAAVLAAYLRDD